MIDNMAISDDPKHKPFRDYKGASVADAWQHGLNPEYWRHCITISQGLGWSVSEAEATRRLNYICVHLLKAMFGNNFRRKGAEIKFMVFEQGSRATFNQHYHALMAIEGDHNWSDEQIAKQSMKSIETDQKDIGRRTYTSILIGSTAIDFTVTLLVMRRMMRTAFR